MRPCGPRADHKSCKYGMLNIGYSAIHSRQRDESRRGEENVCLSLPIKNWIKCANSRSWLSKLAGGSWAILHNAFIIQSPGKFWVKTKRTSTIRLQAYVIAIRSARHTKKKTICIHAACAHVFAMFTNRVHGSFISFFATRTRRRRRLHIAVNSCSLLIHTHAFKCDFVDRSQSRPVVVYSDRDNLIIAWLQAIHSFISYWNFEVHGAICGRIYVPKPKVIIS